MLRRLFHALAPLRPLPWLVVGSAATCWVVEPHSPPNPVPEAPRSDRAAAFQTVSLLARDHQLSASLSDVHFAGPIGSPALGAVTVRAFVLASKPRAPSDVFLLHVTRAPEGGVLRISRVFNLSSTQVAEESVLRVHGERAAWLVGDGTQSYSLKIADAAGGADTERFSRLEQLQLAGTFWQETGQFRGVPQRSFKLDPPALAPRVTLTSEELRLSALHMNQERVLIPNHGPPTAGAHWVAEQVVPLARPGNWITWAVDRVRASSPFGDAQLQWLKAVAYSAKDHWERTRARLLGDPRSVGSQDFDLATNTLDPSVPAPARAAISETPAPPRLGPGTRWPPKNLVPRLTPALEQEGEWISLDGDPFIRSTASGRSPFVTTFIRTDPDRPFARTLVVAWDPQIVSLHMMSGTEEPKSATGETGTGLIPRDPETLASVVAAFNGGFQATHGGFGMQVEGTVYVPPRPFAATVARLDDGSVGFGTWPRATHPVPEWIASFRQNLTPLLQDGVFNPYGRDWWGGVPEGWTDDTRTVRSGLCLTQQGLLAYFYGAQVDHTHLAQAMLSVGCDYALHLDMNQGHTGLEFYHLAPEAQLPTLALPLSTMWQAEGPLDDTPGYRFRGRRLFRSMQLMNFPRYIQRQARDFFYLTLRPALPGPQLPTPLPAALAGEGVWSSAEFNPQADRPAAARTWLRPDPARPGTKLHLLQIDPSALALTPGAPSETPLLSLVPPAGATADHRADEVGVYWSGSRFHLFSPAMGGPPPGSEPLLRGARQAQEASAAWGLSPVTGFLIYAEVATGAEPAADSALLAKALHLAGASEAIFLTEPVRFVIAGKDLSGHPASGSATAVRLYSHDAPKFRRIFKDTPIVEPSVWKPLQKSED